MQALVVEDQPAIRGELARALTEWGFEAHTADGGLAGLQRWQAMQPALVLLDLGLPDIDGLDVLQQARRQGLAGAVLLLSARVTVADRILGLNLGADDYLGKPFDIDELRARVAALVRRSLPSTAPPAAGALQLGELQWDEDHDGFVCGGKPLALTPREFALLQALARQPNRALARDCLLKAVYPRGGVQGEALEVLTHRLRKKLAACGVELVTLRGLGYLIRPAVR